jgi:preprotein translocase subunit SecA
MVSATLGKRLQTEIYRHLLLSVISEQWVDYLTKVEGLRVSIGMEAYAQRNPLVEYKGQATRMFGELLSDIRQGVIGRMFTTQPRRSSEASVQAVAPSPVPENATASQPAPERPASPAAKGPALASPATAAPRQSAFPAATPVATRPGSGSDGKKKRKRH